jgi:catechol 2,3-dioxygenase-like lactoylglutathione lyase family enzyme
MRIIKLAWIGTRTTNADETSRFFRDVLGLREDHTGRDFWVLTLPDGAKVEIFGPQTEWNPHFTNCPVAGFLVDDVHAATEELRTAGTEIVHGPITMGDNVWVHFRAPDGNLYEFTQDPGVDRPA